ncbi:Glutamate--tRNA ligase [Fusarium oxysporum f. sp. albedinis]|nr:Glutamate--tRNA ligase [Fusarium oxysporum f. sp. albedinis]
MSLLPIDMLLFELWLFTAEPCNIDYSEPIRPTYESTVFTFATLTLYIPCMNCHSHLRPSTNVVFDETCPSCRSWSPALMSVS